MIQVIASIELEDNCRADFLEIFKANVPAVKAEDGCIGYLPSVDFDSGMDIQDMNPNVVTIIEAWESLEHLHAHLKAPHMDSYREKVKGMVKSLSLKVLEPA